MHEKGKHKKKQEGQRTANKEKEATEIKTNTHRTRGGQSERQTHKQNIVIKIKVIL